jgi:hypothetical protein
MGGGGSVDRGGAGGGGKSPPGSGGSPTPPGGGEGGERDGGSGGRSGVGGPDSGGTPSGGAGDGGTPSGAAGEGASSGNGGTGGAEGGSGGATNHAPTTTFDHYHFWRRTEAAENEGGAAGAVEWPLTYAEPAGPKSPQKNDSDPEGATLTLAAGTITTERGGSVTIAADGAFAYSPPNPRFWGNDFFEYSVSDGESSSSGRARITLSDKMVRFEELEAAGSNGWLMTGTENHEAFGYVAQAAGDVNGDGIEDLIVGAPGYWVNSDGAAYVVFGRKETTPLSMADLEAGGSSAGFMIKGFRLPYELGFPVSGAGDLNGDGLGDLVLSSMPDEASVTPSVYVVLGRRETTAVDLGSLTVDGSSVGIRINPLNTVERFGTSVAGVGDVNGDGYDDLAIGAPGAPRDSNPEVGAVYVLCGHTQFGRRKTSLQEIIEGSGDRLGFFVRGKRADSRAGFSVAGAGDVNGDGLADIAIGAPEEQSEIFYGTVPGSAYVVFGMTEPDTVDLGWLEAGYDAGFVIWGMQNFLTALGYSVSGAGFFNEDGLEDILTGIPDYTTPENYFHGGAYVTFGRTEARSEPLDQGQVPVSGYLVRAFSGARFQGRSVAAGDFDGDGWSDLSMAGSSNAVQSFIAFGGDGQIGSRHLSVRYACEGATVAGVHTVCFDHLQSEFETFAPTAAGDFNGDGIDDVYVGAPGRLAPGGSAYVVFGWDVRDRVYARHLVHAGGSGEDTIHYSGDALLRLSGGAGVDTIVLDGPSFTWDLRAVEPTRLVSIERIDLSGPGDHSLILDDNHVRILPSSRPKRPAGLAKTLTVVGDAGDTLRVDLQNFDELQPSAGRRTFRRTGGYYGLEVEGEIAITAP